MSFILAMNRCTCGFPLVGPHKNNVKKLKSRWQQVEVVMGSLSWGRHGSIALANGRFSFVIYSRNATISHYKDIGKSSTWCRNSGTTTK